ncbi:FMN reductase [Plantibacter cousiniae (nom. nud.)]|uniref:FMN reductase n=1 Tax=Plantibacter cousiniae (nom. nud.) TaxID=199709 RepID=A0ABY1LSM1_9MICO|nr:FMN reductase [Plantibacter cousiniae]SKC72902.1 FMN reductase [Plantibacter cousiniae]
MNAKRTLAVVSAGLSQPSSTRLLADRLRDATVARLEQDGYQVETTSIELRDLAQDITNNLLTGFPSPRLSEAIEAMTAVDGVIAVTPIFSSSYSGLFKSFFDVVEPTALTGVPVALGATGGSARHSLALEYAVRPLFAYLRAVTVPTAVFAASEDWGSGDAQVGALPARIDRAAGELSALVAASDRSGRLDDPFALDRPFSELLGGLGA